MAAARAFLRFIYTLWCFAAGIVAFLLIAPFVYLFLLSKRTYGLVHRTNIVGAHLIHLFCGLPIQKVWQFKPNKSEQYIYCSNHSSYLDITTLFASIPGKFSIIGKAAIGKWPLFGYMFRKMYVVVDRASKNGRTASFKQVLAALDNGKSMCFFPEGTIPKHNKAPEMGPFKPGAFKAAIQKQLPIVPVAIPYNWKILLDRGTATRARWHRCKIIFLPPIPTIGMSLEDSPALSAHVRSAIEKELL